LFFVPDNKSFSIKSTKKHSPNNTKLAGYLLFSRIVCKMEALYEKTTNGVNICLKREYIAEHSKPELGSYFFAYTITITNFRPHRIQLLRRKWKITDYATFIRNVEGEGVVGVMPVLDTGESHSYNSFCELATGLGEMEGFYTFLNFQTMDEFEAAIPRFQLIAPWKLN
jgi:ApaG protein